MRLKVAVFAAGGAIPAATIRGLATRHEIVAVVRPRTGGRLARLSQLLGRSGSRDDCDRATREVGAPKFGMERHGDEAIARLLRSLRPDVVVIATFPWMLRDPVLAVAPLGGVNLHSSLLPRHRGPNPYLWAYHANDRETGMTVHVADERVDAGCILAQVRVPIPRGYPVARLHDDLAHAGSALVVDGIDALERGVEPTPQDESVATRAPKVAPGTRMVNFADWPVERVWHFLSGMVPLFIEPLDAGGRELPYGAVAGFEEGEPRGAPGTVEPFAQGWHVWCRDGAVRLTVSPTRRRSGVSR